MKGWPCMGRLGQVSKSGLAEQQLIMEGEQGRSNPATHLHLEGFDAPEQHIPIYFMVLTMSPR